MARLLTFHYRKLFALDVSSFETYVDHPLDLELLKDRLGLAFVAHKKGRLPAKGHAGANAELRTALIEQDRPLSYRDFPSTSPHYVSGYFQDYTTPFRLGHSFAAELWLALSGVLGPGRAESLGEHKSRNFIHLRRGNFRTTRVGVLSDDYLLDALDLIAVDEPFTVLSDDPVSSLQSTLRTLTQAGYHVSVFPGGDNLSSFEVLFLLAQSDRLVMANSTISWWAGFFKEFLLSNTRGIVAPSRWVEKADCQPNLTPPHWIRVRSKFC